jgi:hypothetical protein
MTKNRTTPGPQVPDYTPPEIKDFMKVYLVKRKLYALSPMNMLAANYGDCDGGSYLHSIQAFHRRKDAQAYIDKFKWSSVPMEIVTFESISPGGRNATTPDRSFA